MCTQVGSSLCRSLLYWALLISSWDPLSGIGSVQEPRMLELEAPQYALLVVAAPLQECQLLAGSRMAWEVGGEILEA